MLRTTVQFVMEYLLIKTHIDIFYITFYAGDKDLL